MSLPTLNRYLQKYTNLHIYCPQCEEEMTFYSFRSNHASERHGINSRLRCVFCFGSYHWKRGEKIQPKTTKHMVECLKQFIDLNTIRQPIVPETPIESLVVLCGCRHFVSVRHQMANRLRDRLSEYIGFYISIFEKYYMWTGRFGVRFSSRSGLNSDVFWIVQRFLQKDMRWFHLMVKHNAFDTFVREMTPIQEHFVLLPFWCLCDGLKNGEGRKVTHRHMILACDDSGLFEKVWADKVRLSGEKAKTCRKIETPFHLVRTIAYVSTPKASCDKGIPDDNAYTQHREYSHFHFNRPQSNHTIASLCTLYKDGMKDLCIEQFKNRNVVDWVEKAVLARDSPTHYHKKWAVQLKYTGFKFLNCVLPVEKNLEPSDEETDMFVYLNAETKLYFKENEQLVDLTYEEWIAHQIKKGNTLRAIENELYYYTPKQQNMMNQIKQNEETTRNRVEARWELVFSNLNDKISKLKNEKNELREENNDIRIRLADSENTVKEQREENNNLNARIASLEKDKILKLKMNDGQVNFEYEK